MHNYADMHMVPDLYIYANMHPGSYIYATNYANSYANMVPDLYIYATMAFLFLMIAALMDEV